MNDFRPADVLRVTCPAAAAEVTKVSPHYVSLRWPWRQVDPNSRFRWNGDRAFPRRGDHYEWDMELFRLQPEASELAEGEECQVGIPATTVHVLSVNSFDPPRDVGWLPRPTESLHVLRHGESFDPDLEEQGCTVDPGGQEPIELELLFRPYAFLQVGDEVADAHGEAWRLEHPLAWHSFSGRTGAPTWPLILLSRGGSPVEGDCAVAEATADGSHEAEEARWRSFTNAEPSTGRLRR